MTGVTRLVKSTTVVGDLSTFLICHTLQSIFLLMIFLILENCLLGKGESWTPSHQRRMPCINIISVLVIKMAQSGIDAWSRTQKIESKKSELGNVTYYEPVLTTLPAIEHALTALVKCCCKLSCGHVRNYTGAAACTELCQCGGDWRDPEIVSSNTSSSYQ